MNGSITIRLPELGITEQQENAVDTRPSEAPVSDEALIAEVCLGSREALAILFRRYARLVRAVALRVLKDASEADDLLQDIFLLIHRLSANLRRFQGDRTILDSANDLSPRHLTAALSQFPPFLYASGTR